MKSTCVAAARVLTVLAGVVLAGGCVSLDEYRQLEATQRRCNSERERLNADLANSRSQSKTLQDRIDELEKALGGRERAMTLLERQAGEAQDSLSKMTEIYEKLAAQRVPSGTIVIKQISPELDAALKDFAAKHPGQVEYDAQRGMLKFVSDVLFDSGKDVVKPNAVATIDELAKIVASPAAAKFEVRIVGHTDNDPIKYSAAQHPTNWHLSVHRAIAVMNVLVKGGMAPDRIGVMGYGEFRPVAPNDTRTNKALNRRVELYLYPRQASAAQAPRRMAPMKRRAPKPAEEK